jgi:hypothetical protein
VTNRTHPIARAAPRAGRLGVTLGHIPRLPQSFFTFVDSLFGGFGASDSRYGGSSGGNKCEKESYSAQNAYFVRQAPPLIRYFGSVPLYTKIILLSIPRTITGIWINVSFWRLYRGEHNMIVYLMAGLTMCAVSVYCTLTLP